MGGSLHALFFSLRSPTSLSPLQSTRHLVWLIRTSGEVAASPALKWTDQNVCDPKISSRGVPSSVEPIGLPRNSPVQAVLTDNHPLGAFGWRRDQRQLKTDMSRCLCCPGNSRSPASQGDRSVCVSGGGSVLKCRWASLALSEHERCPSRIVDLSDVRRPITSPVEANASLRWRLGPFLVRVAGKRSAPGNRVTRLVDEISLYIAL